MTGLKVESASKQFDTGVLALQNATFDVAEGQFVALVGPSGCGKSTLLRMVAGLLQSTSGSLSFKGEQIHEPRADMGFMFQKPTLLPWKTALQNALIPADVRHEDRNKANAKAKSLLSMVGLEGFEHQFPNRLSGGMQQRVALARLLMTGADLLLLDEPFGALDEFTREHLNLELLRIHEEFGHTTLFVTHNISEAVFLSDKVVVMSARPGRVEAVVDIPFPRPRETDLMRSADFTDAVFEIRNLLGDQI